MLLLFTESLRGFVGGVEEAGVEGAVVDSIPFTRFRRAALGGGTTVVVLAAEGLGEVTSGVELVK